MSSVVDNELGRKNAKIVISGGNEDDREAAALALSEAGFMALRGDALGQLRATVVGVESSPLEVPDWSPEADAHVSSATLRTPAALLIFNIDHFKRVRAMVGGEVAKRLLSEVMARIQSCAKAHDAARGRRGSRQSEVRNAGGDEFAILLPSMDDADEPVELAHAVLIAICRPYEAIAPQVFLTARGGIALAPHHGRDAAVLFRRAVSIIHHEIRDGRNTVRVYTPGSAASSVTRFELEAELSRAVRAGEMEVHYQPQLCIATNRLVGAEALLRWRRPGIGPVPAEIFIAVAEDLGLISELGTWVLSTAARQIETWKQAGLPPVRIAINTSAYQFRRLDMVEVMMRALADSGVAAEYLMLEVTESLVLSEVDRTLDTLRRLRRMGIKIALDDFGTGYSSLSYIKNFAIDCVKIDCSFVSGLPHNKGDLAVTEAIIHMARALNLEVTAEGVENEEQRACLAALGCDYYQGFLYAKALPADKFAELLKRESKAQAATNS